jgi:hypothetical protein
MAVKQLLANRRRVQAGANPRWLMVFMAFLGTTINYIDRGCKWRAIEQCATHRGRGEIQLGLPGEVCAKGDPSAAWSVSRPCRPGLRGLRQQTGRGSPDRGQRGQSSRIAPGCRATLAPA